MSSATPNGGESLSSLKTDWMTSRRTDAVHQFAWLRECSSASFSWNAMLITLYQISCPICHLCYSLKCSQMDRLHPRTQIWQQYHLPYSHFRCRNSIQPEWTTQCCVVIEDTTRLIYKSSTSWSAVISAPIKPGSISPRDYIDY